MALPKEPRQKMINLMYLVLTALLALNVSAEILNAFKTVDHSLSNANDAIDHKNDEKFTSFKELEKDPGKAERAILWGGRATEAKKIADELVVYIEGLKAEIRKSANEDPKTGAYKEDDLEAATRIMTSPGTKGKELLQRLTDFKNGILGINDSIKNQFSTVLPIDLSIPHSNNEASQKDWASAYFNMTPAIAALTILRKFQNDVKNSEAMVVDYCHQQVGAVVYVNDNYKPIVALSSSYLMNGQELNVTAGVAAFNSANQPVISIDGQSEATGLDGMVEKKIIASGIGAHNIHVSFSYKDQNGKPQTFAKDYPYTVGEPTGISVSADAVKVLYVGLDNPLSVSAGNAGSEQVAVTTDNGNIVRGASAGKWVARPGKPGNANIIVNVAGKPTPFVFKVKTVPDPVAKVGNSKGGQMSVNDFKAQFGVRADLENFIFDGVHFSIASYTLVVTGGKKGFQFRPVTGASFDPVRDIIEGLTPNTNVTIDEIKAMGPDGERDLPPITFNLR